jgi:acyl-coenzyme A synthetase/AMP-(fatty) acid ligase
MAAQRTLSVSLTHIQCALPPAPLEQAPSMGLRTEWVLLTSGTTGVPKMVVHDLAGLTHIAAANPAAGADVWLHSTISGATEA